ncbi:MAG TPA: hypothetical protein VJI68_02705 [Candidatus Nanoarchaeia archaeon]|nr:hypothetical protein [Candidatus Nanoarchaeia archaeon]
MIQLENADIFLTDVERALNELDTKHKGKQSERFLTSHLWMIDHLDRNIIVKLVNLKENMAFVRDKNNDLPRVHFDTIMKFSDDIILVMQDMIDYYKYKPSYLDVDLKWQQNLPRIMEKFKSIKNRHSLIKSQIKSKKTQKEEQDNWFR